MPVSLYDQVLSVSKVYLGPAADKFIERQCKMLKTPPVELAAGHLEQLAWLCKNAAGLVMDEVKAAEFGTKLKSLK